MSHACRVRTPGHKLPNQAKMAGLGASSCHNAVCGPPRVPTNDSTCEVWFLGESKRCPSRSSATEVMRAECVPASCHTRQARRPPYSIRALLRKIGPPSPQYQRCIGRHRHITQASCLMRPVHQFYPRADLTALPGARVCRRTAACTPLRGREGGRRGLVDPAEFRRRRCPSTS
jgi:hypothetical protein